MSRHHIIITGTGRAGTTFLIQLFTSLGLPTGYTDLTTDVNLNCQAGMEWDIRQPGAPYIIKTPWLCDYLDDLLEAAEVAIDQAIVPVRHLYAAAESRRDVARRTALATSTDENAGGLWHPTDPQQQEMVLANQLYKLIFTLAKRDIPLTLLYFPRLIHDPAYLYRRLEAILNGITYTEFSKTFQQVARPE